MEREREREGEGEGERERETLATGLLLVSYPFVSSTCKSGVRIKGATTWPSYAIWVHLFRRAHSISPRC